MIAAGSDHDRLGEIHIRISRLPVDIHAQNELENQIEQWLLYLAEGTGVEYTMGRREWWGTLYWQRSYRQPLTWLERTVYWAVIAVGAWGLVAAVCGVCMLCGLGV